MSVLIKKTDEVETGFPIGVVLNRKETRGDIGLEIEVEGKKLPHSEVPFKYWQHHLDHSLRGEENAEYVLKAPLPFDKVGTALDELWGQFKEFKSRIDDSNRTSVHVHLNVQKFHMNRLTAFMALYFAMEEILTAWCGDHRVGNLFCLRAKDAPAIISQLRRFIKSDGATELRETLHYAGLNAHALMKFGSIEIRTLRGVADQETIVQWVNILQRLYEYSAEFVDPREICQEFSAMGPVGFFEKILGPSAPVVRGGVGWGDDQIIESMFTGIRLAQDLCYSRDWSNFHGMEMKPDPFGRQANKIAKKLINYHSASFDPMLWEGGNPPIPPAVPSPQLVNTLNYASQILTTAHPVAYTIDLEAASFEAHPFDEEF